MKIIRTLLYGIAVSCALSVALPLAARPLELATSQANAADSAIEAEKLTDFNRWGKKLFGTSVSIDRNTALIGAPFDDVDGKSKAGSVYIYTRKGKQWDRQARLIAQDGANFDHFGHSVAIFGDTALVGAYAANHDRGCAYVFRIKNGEWQLEAKLVANDAEKGDRFGASVALFGDTALVGKLRGELRDEVVQHGSAYVFQRSGAKWMLQDKLLASEQTVNGAFGLSVALSGNTALVGSPYDSAKGKVHQGSVYVFQRRGGRWVEQAKLVASDAAAKAQFGTSVSIDGDLAVIGSPQRENKNKETNPGAAYVFQRKGSTWTEQVILVARDGAPKDFFGSAVAISAHSVLVGAAYAGTGSAYWFERGDQRWLQVTKFVATSSAKGSVVADVALSENSVLIGAPVQEIHGNEEFGSAYVLGYDGKNWIEQAKFRLQEDSAVGETR
jgi:hypothetical protein